MEEQQQSVKRQDPQASNNGGEQASKNGGEQRTRLITDTETLSTLDFYGKLSDDLRAESANSVKQLWSRLNLLSPRVEQIENATVQKFVRSPSLSNERIYKIYKNKLNHLIRLVKRKYYESAKNDVIKTWKLRNEFINKLKSWAPFPSSFESEGKTITDPEEITDKFCKYFINIGPNLASAIRDDNSCLFYW